MNMAEKDPHPLNQFNVKEKLDIRQKTDDTVQPSSASAPAPKFGVWLKYIALGALCAAILIIGAALVLTRLHQDILDKDSDIFVTDSDSLNVRLLSSDVLATGVVYDTCAVYDAPSGSAKVLTILMRGTDLLIYDVNGDFFQVSDASKAVKGYVKKEDVNTFGIDVLPRKGRYPSSPVSSTPSAKNNTDINPADFKVNDSPYFIYVEKGSHTITIYTRDASGQYTVPSATYAIAIGRSSTLTPVGDFKLLAKEAWHSWTTSYSPYCSKFSNGLYFHGPLYRTKGDYQSLIESSASAIGTNATSGCLRTSVAAAYAIYKCPVGTNVKIVNGSPLGRSASRPSIESQRIDPTRRPAAVEDISFGFSYWTLSEGSSFTAWLLYTPDEPTNTRCTWRVSDTSVASLSPQSNGEGCTITGKKAGTAVITAVSEDGGHSTSFTLTVKSKSTSSEAPPVSSGESSAPISSEDPAEPSGEESSDTPSTPDEPPASSDDGGDNTSHDPSDDE